MTDKSDDKERGFERSCPKSSNVRALPGAARAAPMGGGILKCRVDQRIIVVDNFAFNHFNSSSMSCRLHFASKAPSEE